MTKPVSIGKELMNGEKRLNKLVTISHICIILGYTVLSILILNCETILSTLSYYRLKTTFVIFGGTADVFLSVMLWFILNDDQTVTVFVDGNRAYSVVDVIQTNYSVVNSDSDYSQEDRENYFNSSILSAKTSLVADRMIA